jgi:DNA-binding FrmR family transcriptional regulator
MKPDAKKQAHARMRRIAGQVAGVERMIEDDRYCVDVLLQIAAVRAALDRVGKVVLASHVETCVADAFASGSARDQRRKRDELLEVFSRFGKIGGGT